jgi:endonuclease VIII
VPEGQVSHRNAQRFARRLAGQTIIEAWSTDPRVRSQRLDARLVGERITGAEARGKFHLLRFASGRVLVSHLMMSGVWHLYDAPETRPPDRGRVMLGIRVPGYVATLVRCPNVRLLEPGAPLPGRVRALGPDLLDPAVDPAAAVRDALAQVTGAREIGEALLDQRIIAGIGNVYKSESLFLAGVDPWRPVASLDDTEAETVGAIAAELLAKGTRHRGPISTYDPPGWLPSRGPSGMNWVYGRNRKPCRRCGTRILARGQGDTHRTTYWCPSCQT